MGPWTRTTWLPMLLCLAVASPLRGITIRAEGRSDLTVSATTQAGETPLLVRQIRFDRGLSSGGIGKSVLFLLFEPISGFTYRTVRWTERDYPDFVQANKFPPDCHVAIAPDRLALFTFLNTSIVVEESRLRSSRLDAAEADAWSWVGANSRDIEARRPADSATTIHFAAPLATGFPPRSAFPDGFFSELVKLDAFGRLPLKWEGVAPNGDGWTLTFENTESHQRIMIPLIRRGAGWLLGYGKVER